MAFLPKVMIAWYFITQHIRVGEIGIWALFFELSLVLDPRFFNVLLENAGRPEVVVFDLQL